MLQEVEPIDQTSWKFWRLLKLGYSRDKLLEGLSVLSRGSWSTSVTEQGHAAASGLLKLHRMYGDRTVQDRAL